MRSKNQTVSSEKETSAEASFQSPDVFFFFIIVLKDELFQTTSGEFLAS